MKTWFATFIFALSTSPVGFAAGEPTGVQKVDNTDICRNALTADFIISFVHENEIIVLPGRIQKENEMRLTIQPQRNVDGGPSPRTLKQIVSEVFYRWIMHPGGFVLRPLAADSHYFHAGKILSFNSQFGQKSPYVRDLDYTFYVGQWGETAKMSIKILVGAQKEHVKVWRTGRGAVLRLKEWSPIDKPNAVTSREIYFKTPGTVRSERFHQREEYRVSLPSDWPEERVNSALEAFGALAETTLGLGKSNTPPQQFLEFSNERWGVNFNWIEGNEYYPQVLKDNISSLAQRLGKLTIEKVDKIGMPTQPSLYQVAIEIDSGFDEIVLPHPRHLEAFIDYFKYYFYGQIDLRSKHEQLLR